MRIGDVEVLVETTPIAGTELASAADAVREKVADSFEHAKATIVAVGKSAVDIIERLSESPVARPSSVEIDIGLGFTVDGRVILAAASASATLNVHLVYEMAAEEGIRKAGTDGDDG
jgi:hypothetical protein